MCVCVVSKYPYILYILYIYLVVFKHVFGVYQIVYADAEVCSHSPLVCRYSPASAKVAAVSLVAAVREAVEA